MKRETMLAGIALLASVAVTQEALAHEAGDLVLRLGAATVAPNDSSSALSLTGVGKIPGSEAKVGSDTQLGITGTYMLTDHLGLGLLAATPFEHNVKANTGSLGPGTVDAGKVKHLPPTLTLQYYPLANDAMIQPYAGVGINYTVFFGESVDSDLESVLGSGDLKLNDSWGLAFEAGVDVAISDHWLVNAALWYLNIDTKADFSFPGGTSIKADVDIDPWVYALTVGYTF